MLITHSQNISEVKAILDAFGNYSSNANEILNPSDGQEKLIVHKIIRGAYGKDLKAVSIHVLPHLYEKKHNCKVYIFSEA